MMDIVVEYYAGQQNGSRSYVIALVVSIPIR